MKKNELFKIIDSRVNKAIDSRNKELIELLQMCIDQLSSNGSTSLYDKNHVTTKSKSTVKPKKKKATNKTPVVTEQNSNPSVKKDIYSKYQQLVDSVPTHAKAGSLGDVESMPDVDHTQLDVLLGK